MAVYLCDHCDEWLDDDYHPMEPHPWAGRFPKQHGSSMVCPECAAELEYEMTEALLEDLLD